MLPSMQKMGQILCKGFPGTGGISCFADEEKSVFPRKKLQNGTIISGLF